MAKAHFLFDLRIQIKVSFVDIFPQSIDIYSFFSQGQESLSVLDLSKDKHFHVKHYRIRRTDQGLYYISSKSVFPSLQDLVDHYRSKYCLVFHGKYGCVCVFFFKQMLMVCVVY